MSVTTNIEWATSTGNPWLGCRRVSEGCANCYMFEQLGRFGIDATKRRRTVGFWKDALKWNREAGLTGNRHTVFPSMCDWLDDEVPIEWLADFLKLIHDTPHLTWLLLTKRPELFERIEQAVEYSHGEGWQSLWTQGNAPENVWLGVSVENQKRADERIPQLLSIPAKVRFLSCEPLLENIDLRYPCFNGSDSIQTLAGIDWVIIGGESGRNRRDPGVEAIIDLARQCQAAGVPTFVKQDCGLRPGKQGRIPDDIWQLKQFPKI